MSGGLGKVLYLLVLAGLAVGVVLGLRKKSVAAIGVLTTPFVFALVPVRVDARDAVGRERALLLLVHAVPAP